MVKTIHYKPKILTDKLLSKVDTKEFLDKVNGHVFRGEYARLPVYITKGKVAKRIKEYLQKEAGLIKEANLYAKLDGFDMGFEVIIYENDNNAHILFIPYETAKKFAFLSSEELEEFDRSIGLMSSSPKKEDEKTIKRIADSLKEFNSVKII